MVLPQMIILIMSDSPFANLDFLNWQYTVTCLKEFNHFLVPPVGTEAQITYNKINNTTIQQYNKINNTTNREAQENSICLVALFLFWWKFLQKDPIFQVIILNSLKTRNEVYWSYAWVYFCFMDGVKSRASSS